VGNKPGPDWGIKLKLDKKLGSWPTNKHPTKTGRVTIAGHPNDDLAPGTLNSILKQARLKEVK
jgi:predicted RNA binding protein YcfA (HicA-like mRNA interferase family)